MVDLASIVLVRPCDIALCMITQPFGGSHNGVDYGSFGGANIPITPAQKGAVEQIQTSSSGYGNMVLLNHGGYYTRYAHLQRIDVSMGQYVMMGQQLGLMGTTGNSTGVHLHFELIVPENPAPGFPKGERNAEMFYGAITPGEPPIPTIPGIEEPLAAGDTVMVTASLGLQLHTKPEDSIETRIVAVPYKTKMIVESTLESPWIELKVYAHKDWLKKV